MLPANPLTMFKTILGRIVSYSAHNPLRIITAAIIMVLAAGAYAAASFDMNSSTAGLISPETKWRQNEIAVSKAFPQLDDTIVVVVDGKTPELAQDGADRLAAAMAEDSDNFARIRRPDGGEYFDREGLMFGSVAEVREATQGLIDAQPLLGGLAYDPSLRGIANSIGTAAEGAASDTDSAGLDRLEAPLASLDGAIASVLDGTTTWFSWQELFATGEGDLAPSNRQVILAQGKLDFSDLKPGTKATDAIRAAAKELELDEAHGVSVGITGEVPLADEEFGSIEENIGIVGMLMGIAMLVTLWFATRSGKTVAAIAITILSGLLITLALGLLAVGALNIISVAFIPLFVGLGVDFGIQVSVRFNAERREGAGLSDALERAAAAIGAPITLAATAICLALFGFLPTDYVGIAELGIISAIGMVIALALNVTLLPALLMRFAPAPPKSEVGFAEAAPVDAWLHRNRKAILASFVIAMLASIAALPFVKFDFNVLHLRDPHTPAMTSLAGLMDDPLRTPNTLTVMAKDADEADHLAGELAELPEVRNVITLDSFVPEDQEEKVFLIEDAAFLLDATINPFDFPPEIDDPSTVTALEQASTKLEDLADVRQDSLGTAAGKLSQTLARLAQATPEERQKAEAVLAPPLDVTLNKIRYSLQATEVSRDTLPPEIAADWVTDDGRALVQLVPEGDSTDNAVIERFTEAVRKVAPNAVGLPVATQEAARTVSGAFVQAGVIALVLVCLLLFAVLRSIREVAFTMAPVVLSIFLTLGSCILIGQPLNFANIIAFPLLFGVGVAFHIYFVMAWREGTGDLLQTSLARAVMFSALATGSAFGALWFSHHPGTASMGLILMISLIWTLICALIFEPALLGPPEEHHHPKAPAQ